jgi:vacuolar-type H+-ATPase subunit C/Vma6
MRNYADIPYLHTRIYAMRSRLFSLRDYAMMIREQEAIPGNVSGIPDLNEAKETLFKQQISPVINLTRAYEKYTPFFIANLRQYETHNAKILLAKAAGHQTLTQWYDIGPFATLDKGLLAESLSLDEIKSLLAGIYLDENFKAISSYRQLAVHLDVCTAGNFYHSADSLSGSATLEFREMMLKRLAVMTLIWSYRLKAYYRFNQERIHFYMARVHELYGGKAEYRVSLEQEALDRRLEQMRKDTGQEPSVVDIEHHLELNYYAWITSMFHRDFQSIYCVVSYLWLLFYQIRNLFRIIEGKRFGLSADAILNRIICEA